MDAATLKAELEKETDFQDQIKKVTGPETWNTFNPESHQTRFAELYVMRSLWEPWDELDHYIVHPPTHFAA